MPLVILIDTNGIIAYKGQGFKDSDEFQSNIDTLLSGKKLKHQIGREALAVQEQEKRKCRKSNTEMMPSDIHDKFSDFEHKLEDIK